MTDIHGTREQLVELIGKLTAERDQFKLALEEIVNPLQFMKRRAEANGYVLSGMAYSIGTSTEHRVGIARGALAKSLTEV